MNNIANIKALIQSAQQCIDAGNYYDASSMLSQVVSQLNNFVAARHQYGTETLTIFLRANGVTNDTTTSTTAIQGQTARTS